jgi:hypothetical protein
MSTDSEFTDRRVCDDSVMMLVDCMYTDVA